MYLLAIESSCDDTSASVLADGRPCSNVVSSQLVHSSYGGVVPEMASRQHQQNIWVVVNSALDQAGITVKNLDAIAFTVGPGLPGSLMVGASFAKGLALSLQKPLIAVNHMEAHVLSLLMGNPKPAFPFLSLVVSGGHTLLVNVKNWDQMEVMGSTLDDAVGEAFDKCAKMLGLGYPGGKAIDDLAKTGNADRFAFPVAQIPGFDFSYSGVKTAFLYFIREKGEDFVQANLNDLCASIQKALLSPLLTKTRLAMKELGYIRFGVAGGVAANSALRSALTRLSADQRWEISIPDFQYCTDNAAMIGLAAWYKLDQKAFSPFTTVTQPRLAIGQMI